ncbi:MAG: NfeD family protein [Novosphingobium sp.]|nr:NfeD family protein [Novosphingobium sp.]
MEWLDVFDGFDPRWLWLIVGLVLAAAEIVVPGVFLIWIAAAALITGLLTWVLPIDGAVQTVIFAALAVLAGYSGRLWVRAHPIASADPLMNQRGARLVGQRVVVTEAIEGGIGRVRCGGDEWIAHGPDAPVGAHLTITGSDGVVLIVEDVP